MQGRRPRSGHGCGSRERRSRRSGRRTRSTPVPPGSPRGGSKYWDDFVVSGASEPEPPPPEPDPEPVSLVTEVVGDGTVVVDPVQEQYVAGDVVALTATPGDGQLFVGWSGDVSGSENPLTVTLAADGDATTADTTTVAATFESEPPPEPDPEPVSLVTEVDGDGAGVVDPVPTTLAADGDATTADTTSVAATFEPVETNPDSAPVIDVWEGLDQQFGQLGVPQVAVNIHGNVSDPDGISSFTYSLNGDPDVAVRVGPDGRRLAGRGDFNVEVAVVDLVDGPNAVELTAVDGSGETTVQVVNVGFQSGNVWPTTYDVDWNTVAEIGDAAQIVDGKWALENGGLRIVEPAYDRLVAIGDVSWADYEITVPVTINAIDERGFTSGPSGTAAALGLLLRWNGHTDDPIVTSQPKTGWRPYGAIGWWWWDTIDSARLQIMNNGGGTMAGTPYGPPPAVGTTLWYKMRVETQPDGAGRYSLKVWPSTEPEPSSWSLQGQAAPGDAATGSLMLVAHHVDATFGSVQIRPLNATSGLELGVDVSGSGSVAVSPDQPTYAYGDEVTLTATADPDWAFTGWSGGATGWQNPLTLTLTESTQVTAQFSPSNGNPVVTGVRVDPFADAATVSWVTDELTTGSVAYGPTTAYESGTVVSDTLATEHSVNLTGLEPGATYHFRISA